MYPDGALRTPEYPPKSKEKQAITKKRIRATIYEHRTQYTAYGDGLYGLNYQVA